MTLNDAVKRMRGKPNTPITLTIVRKGEQKPIIVTLTRAIIKIQSVKSKLLEPGYAYFRVTQFQEHTGETLATAIQNLYKQNQGAMKGIVLDLRNDPGGLLNGAVAVSAAFLPKNALVVYTDGRTEDAKMRLAASPENYLRGRLKDDYLNKLPPEIKNVPMVVLVNGGSASASEIVAGALQDHKRAVIMGTQTFGKGSVQTILPLGNSTAIKLTTARYYTPNGRSIQAKGIVPDITLDDGTAGRDPALKLREADLDKHLTNDRSKDEKAAAAAPPAPTTNAFNFTPTPRPTGVDEKDTKPEPGEIVAKSDYELSQAVAFLKSRGGPTTRVTTQ
jgi:carboxyl-terminal processing protease